MGGCRPALRTILSGASFPSRFPRPPEDQALPSLVMVTHHPDCLPPEPGPASCEPTFVGNSSSSPSVARSGRFRRAEWAMRPYLGVILSSLASLPRCGCAWHGHPLRKPADSTAAALRRCACATSRSAFLGRSHGLNLIGPISKRHGDTLSTLPCWEGGKSKGTMFAPSFRRQSGSGSSLPDRLASKLCWSCSLRRFQVSTP